MTGARSNSVPSTPEPGAVESAPPVSRAPASVPYPGPSFSLRNRAARVLWSAACLLFFRFTPRPFFAWRAFVLRCFGAKLGRGCRIYRKTRIWAPWNLDCGDEVCVADDVNLYNQGRITLGTRSVISQGAHLCTGSHDYLCPRFELFTRPISVGPWAWVAAEVFIHPGVTIGEGAVIGARAVVTRDMPEWTVCAGHPCVPLKPRPKLF